MSFEFVRPRLDRIDVARYFALATDYDGTLAHDGRVDAGTVVALQRARAARVLLLLVTGRQVDDLASTFEHCDLFDRIVGENGAVLFDPTTGSTTVVGSAPPPPLLNALRQADVPFSAGFSIVATVEPHGNSLQRAVDDLGLDWHVIFNKHSVMALPAGIDKATGLQRAVDDLQIDAAHVIGVGDAENDAPLLRACGLGVAVANAVPELKAIADVTTSGARGAGVVEIIDRLLAADLQFRPPLVDR